MCEQLVQHMKQGRQKRPRWRKQGKKQSRPAPHPAALQLVRCMQPMAQLPPLDEKTPPRPQRAREPLT